jgi:hypothetical protein
MSALAFRRFAFAYGTAFGVTYVVARAWGLALFTVYRSLGIVILGMHRSRDVVDPVMDFLAPEMWWYGWTATAAIGARLIGGIAALLPDRWCRRFWPASVWVTPLAAMIACVYLTIPWFVGGGAQPLEGAPPHAVGLRREQREHAGLAAEAQANLVRRVIPTGMTKAAMRNRRSSPARARVVPLTRLRVPC